MWQTRQAYSEAMALFRLLQICIGLLIRRWLCCLLRCFEGNPADNPECLQALLVEYLGTPPFIKAGTSTSHQLKANLYIITKHSQTHLDSEP